MKKLDDHIISQPIVSIVTPCYNGERFLDRYFQSVMNQTYQSLEVIFVNDGSEDETRHMAEYYGKLLIEKGIPFVLINQKNQGQAAALNNGLKRITGKYFVWPDADDELTTDSIEKRVLFLENHSEYDYCVSKAVGISESNLQKCKVYEHIKMNSQLAIFEELLWGREAHYVCGTYMMRTAFLDQCIPGRDIYTGRGGQNAQLLLPAAWRGKIGFIDDILYRYYIREDSHSHSAILRDTDIVHQLENFERILVETIRRIGMDNCDEYEERVKKHYARLRFGHALNTRDKNLIREQADRLKELGVLSRRDKYLIFRYTNKLINRLRPVG